VAELSNSLMTPHVRLDDPRSLAELAAVLANADLYLGHSMHGYIVSASYDVPGVIVARSGFQKYRGFARHIGRDADIVRNWDKAFLRAAELTAADQGKLIPASVHDALDLHWSRLAEAILDRSAGRARRATFLRSVMIDGLATQGVSWLMESFGNGALKTARAAARNGEP
jgi:hypothetical protein